MAIPSTGSFTSAQVQAEFALPTPHTSEQVRVATSLTNPWTSEQLRGKSGFSVSVSTTDVAESGTSTNRLQTFSATATPVGLTGPFTYAWNWVDDNNPTGAMPVVQKGTTATATARQVYNSTQFSDSYSGRLRVVVTHTASGQTAEGFSAIRGFQTNSSN